MSRSLPQSASLEALKKQARAILNAHRSGDAAACCGTLCHLKQFEGKSDAEVLAGRVSLVEAQYALAMDYGFKSWAELKARVVAATAGRAAAEVRRDGDRIWIEGVPALTWDRDCQTTYVGALAAALAVTDCPYDRDRLMGLSGLAFRIRWGAWSGEPAWCHSAAVGEGPEEERMLAKATGWEAPSHWSGKGVERFVPEIVSSIKDGKPVLCYEPGYNMAVIFGYEDGGRRFLLRNYFKGEEPDVLPVDKLGPLLIFLGKRRAAPPERTALLDALRIAVRNWSRGRSDGGIAGRDYWYGHAALSAWIDDLDRAATFTHEQQEQLHSVGTWVYCVWSDARKSGGEFLTWGADLLDGPASAPLREAAGLYGKEVGLFARVRRNQDAFEGYGGFNRWTADVRARERDVLSEALALETGAVAQMAKSLPETE